MTHYALDTNSAAAADEHTALSDELDPTTRLRISSSVPDMTGWTCLEVGPGRSGTIARWMADQVGEQGLVVAADLKVDNLPAHPQMRPVVHDITSDDPLPYDKFNLIHARLVLMHLPTRRRVLHRLAGMLTPGGIVVIEDWAPRRDQWVVAAPDPEAVALHDRVQHALGAIFDNSGVDPIWAEQIHVAMVEEGLAEVETVGHFSYWTAGHAGLRKLAGTIAQLRPRLHQAGITDTDLADLDELLQHPGLIIRGHPLYSTSGRRPL